MKKRTLTILLTAMFLSVSVKGTAHAVPLTEMGANILQADTSGENVDIFSEELILGTIYLCDEYAIKEQADPDTKTVVSVSGGTTVQILSLEGNEKGVWCKVKAAKDDVEYYGYVQRNYLAVSNANFLALESEMPAANVLSGESYYMNDVEQFPESYRSLLYELKEKHPNWIFVRQAIPMDWDYVIDSELVGARSLIGEYRGDKWKNGNYGSQWAYASRAAVEYCMDPRNYLKEDLIFQFEQLTFNDAYHSVAATQNILQNTFMRGIMPGTNTTYAQNFVEIGQALKVSPFHIASRVAQEQGRGTSSLISGTYPGYEGYYNYFNIGASGSTDEIVIKSGLEKAKQQGWTSPYLSIKGGAAFLANSYIMRGQDTLYLQKFDVDNSYNGVFSHQYMQNIEAPASEGRRIYKAYRDAGAIENTFVFKIPVFQNMPGTPCVSPDTAIQNANIFLLEQGGEKVVAGLVVETNESVDLEYRWLQYDIKADIWSEIQGWTLNNEWCTWYPPKTGDYLFHAEVRVAGTQTITAATIGYHHVSEDDIVIKGMCQMPYEGEGGGFLIGVETNKNPDQKLRYELLIMDCSLYAEGKPAWIWSSGINTVAEGNAFWAVWQPKYGYYLTYFRVYDEEGNLLDDECYGFENV